MPKIYLLFIFIVFSCSNEQNNSVQSIEKLDTIYGNSHYAKDRSSFKHRIPIIKITSPDASYIDFKIGQPDTVVVEVSNFNNHTTEIRNQANVSIEVLDKNLYLFTPSDSIMYIEVWQYYDSGKVVLTVFETDGSSSTSPFSGWRIVGKTDLNAK